MHLNVVAATRSGRRMERSSIGDRRERKGKSGDEKKGVICLALSDQALAYPFPPGPPPRHAVGPPSL